MLCLAQANSPNNLVSRLKHLDAGAMKVSSNLSQLQVGTVVTNGSLLDQMHVLSSTHGLVHLPKASNKQTLTDRLLTSRRSTLNMNSSPISVPASISSDPACVAFWNSFSQEVSKNLWSPIVTDLCALASSCSNTCSFTTDHFLKSTTIMQNRNNTNYKTISWPSSPSSPPNTTENVNMPSTHSSIATLKLRIYPTDKQRILFKKCLDASRYYYNKANEWVKVQMKAAQESRKKELQELNKNGCAHFTKDKQCCKPLAESKYFCEEHKNDKLGICYKFLTHITVRKAVMESDSELKEKIANGQDPHNFASQMLDVPYDTRQLAIKELITAYVSNFAKIKKGTMSSGFEVKFKSRKHMTSFAFHVDKSALNMASRSIFVRRLKGKEGTLRMSARDIKKFNRIKEVKDFQIIYEKPDRWYLCLPHIKTYETKKTHESVFLDPGIRTFQTFWSPDGLCGKIGKQLAPEINAINHEIDWLKSLMTRVNAKRRRSMRDKCQRLRNKAKDIITDVHNKAIHFLVHAYDNICIPTFETKKMSARRNKTPEQSQTRPITRQTVRSMMDLRHFQFRQKLGTACTARGKRMEVVNEAYTSKTCGQCGTIKANLKGESTFRCASCGYVADRDLSAARNICIRYLTMRISS